MKMMTRNLFVFLTVLLGALVTAAPAGHAFWVWTPENNKWINPKYAVKETPARQLDYALSLYRSGDWQQAEIELKKLLKHYERSREAPEALFHLGELYEKQGRLLEAFQAYQSIFDRYPFSQRSAEIIERQYRLANKMLEGTGRQKSLWKTLMGSDYDVVKLFEQIIKNDPYGPYAAVSRYKIGLFLMEKKMYQEARDAFEKVMNDYPTSEWAAMAKYQAALCDALRSSPAPYDQEITRAAVEELERVAKEHPDVQLSAKAREQIRQLREKEAENHFLAARFYEKQKRWESARIYYNTIVERFHDTVWAQKALKRLRHLPEKDQP